MIHRLFLLAIGACFAVTTAMAAPLRVESETTDAQLLRDLRAELVEASAPDTQFEARRQARRAARNAKEYLNSRGYFAPDILYSVEPGPPPVAQLKVESGPQFKLASVHVDLGADPIADDALLAIESVRALNPDDSALPVAILAEEAGLVAALKSAGYGEAAALERLVIGDREAGTLDVTFRLAPGPRLRFGTVIYPSGNQTRTAYLDRLVPFASGDLFSPQKLSTYNRRLNATRMYSVASAQLKETASSVDANGDQIRDVVLMLEARDRYTFSAGASLSTSEGPGLTSSLTRRNATRRGDTLTGAMTLAALERSFSVDWRIPNVTAFDRTLVFSAKAAREETDAFDREALTASGIFEIRRSSRLTYAFGLASEFTREEDALEQRDQQVLSASAAARIDRSSDPLDPTYGWRADLRIEPAVAIGDRSAQFLTVNGQVSAYQALDDADRFIFAGRVRNAFVYGTELANLPVSRRFFAGGGGSARGFEYQSVGPEDANGIPIGGRGLLEFSGELRWRRDKPLGFVAFLDGATVSTDQSVRFEEIRYSAGLGVRYKTPVGPIRFDLATPLDPNPGDDPIQIYVSIGQAF